MIFIDWKDFMKNKKITRKITQGVYALTTMGGGCIVDAVSQVSAGDYPCISVAVMKTNHTHDLMKKENRFALSVLGKKVAPKIIQIFGMNSMRNLNKFQMIPTQKEMELPIIPDSLGYMICEIIDSIDMDTHTLFIGKLIEADILQEGEAMSYGYYQDHKEDYVKVNTSCGKTAWICTACGYIYYGEEIPQNFKCPQCGLDCSYFKKLDN